MDPQEPHSSSSSSRPLLLNNLLDNTSICDICIRTIIEFECIINTHTRDRVKGSVFSDDRQQRAKVYERQQKGRQALSWQKVSHLMRVIPVDILFSVV